MYSKKSEVFRGFFIPYVQCGTVDIMNGIQVQHLIFVDICQLRIKGLDHDVEFKSSLAKNG
jgi:hypothetical protein